MTSPLARRPAPFFLRPICLHSIAERCPVNAKTLGEQRNRNALSAVCGKQCSLPICLLLFRCSPPAVFSRIALLVVNAINGVAHRALAHISQKIVKAKPSLANLNASRSVRGELRRFFVCATMPHFGPRSVGRRLTPPGSVAVRSLVKTPRAFAGAKPPAPFGDTASVCCKADSASRTANRNNCMFSRHRHPANKAQNLAPGNEAGMFINIQGGW